MPHKITLERQTLRFAAAHFTASPSECEPLHGHNYDVFIDIHGHLTPESWIIDFGEAKAIARALCEQLDHRFLLPTANRVLRVNTLDGHIEITYGTTRYVMPESDVARLEIDNSTAERLAEWFANRLARALAQRGAHNITMITVGIEEMPGQAGWFTLDL